MRLVNIHTLELGFFFLGSVPPYITLSHRWTDNETTFEDYQTNVDSPGRRKVEEFCRFVRWLESRKSEGKQKRVEWIWIDTCCIDKRSSAELQESINSMARWYMESEYCVAYMNDVQGDGREDLRRSEWFRRGWTLQELLFPGEIVFCNADWENIGTKSDNAFSEELGRIAGIPARCLREREYMLRQCVARKMSWASQRVTTRVEDTAYCLLGLFNIQMSLLYGEGKNAFSRLQEEIIRQTDDESVLAWSLPMSLKDEWKHWWRPEKSDLIRCPSALAPHPKYFEASGQAHLAGIAKRKPYRMTNKGLEFETRTIELKNEKLIAKTLYIVELNCGRGRLGESPEASDRSSLIALKENRVGRYERLAADPSKLPQDWTSDEYLWRYLSGYDAENTRLKETDTMLFYIRLSAAASAVGSLNFNDTPYMEAFTSVGALLRSRGRHKYQDRLSAEHNVVVPPTYLGDTKDEHLPVPRPRRSHSARRSSPGMDRPLLKRQLFEG